MKSHQNLPPFGKGDRGGFRRSKRKLKSIERSQMVTRQKLQIAYLNAQGVYPRPKGNEAVS